MTTSAPPFEACPSWCIGDDCHTRFDSDGEPNFHNGEPYTVLNGWLPTPDADPEDFNVTVRPLAAVGHLGSPVVDVETARGFVGRWSPGAARDFAHALIIAADRAERG